MGREKIKVPAKVYDELVALKREIHFTLDQADTIKKAEDRGYMTAATWIRQNENAYKIGFTWGFEPSGDEQKGMLRDIPAPEAPIKKRTIDRPIQTMEARGSKKSPGSGKSTGILAGFRNWLKKYF
jgi:hypothetical protein